ncbi:helix-turn-helix domain-containing protein [Epilithonimonas zeae]|uniref:helix-turn-helix domain-containing protein n=1 Tax=Epilithonimonas zeae TaxID=1416779 RepID=UPI00200F4C0D|nr:AraC family transcriptional regulator [Epilithonimonas zeae]UQB69164.1 helix-turn-helix transcriptional regulator [Epilithonimonas zeae]
MKKIYFITILLIFKSLYSQQKQFSDFYELKKNYEYFPENDSRAFQFLNKAISLSKKEKNNYQLVQAYKDAVFYTASSKDKLKYADSTILSALSTKDNDLISDAFLGKGIIYYFNYKKYKSALDQYLKAYQYSENTKDEYLKNEILYHLGVVKSYLGYYDSALEHFQKANQFFYKGIQEKAHPNIIFNNKKGYYNTLHRIIVCQRNLKNYKALNSLINIGLSQTQNNPDYKQEYGYFLKEKGIEAFRNKKFTNAISSLQESQKPLLKIKDFSWATVNYFYIGKSYLANDNPAKAILYFKKVDSVFQKHNFILPELRENYELLILHYKDQKDTDKELYYTKQLLQADRIINKDFAYLSSTIHKKFDTKILQDKLNNTNSVGAWIVGILSSVAITLMLLLVMKEKNERKTRINYKILEDKILNSIYTLAQDKIKIESPEHHEETEKCPLNENLVENLLCKLKSFEDKCGYIENGLTINKLAHKLRTNSTYLSQVINDHKGMNFNRYLGELRINYITNKLYTDKVYLNYKIETLAEKCGIASRTNFSNLFREINGMRPTEFIKKRQEYITKNTDDSKKNFPILSSTKKIIL